MKEIGVLLSKNSKLLRKIKVIDVLFSKNLNY